MHSNKFSVVSASERRKLYKFSVT